MLNEPSPLKQPIPKQVDNHTTETSTIKDAAPEIIASETIIPEQEPPQ